MAVVQLLSCPTSPSQGADRSPAPSSPTYTAAAQDEMQSTMMLSTMMLSTAPMMKVPMLPTVMKLLPLLVLTKTQKKWLMKLLLLTEPLNKLASAFLLERGEGWRHTKYSFHFLFRMFMKISLVGIYLVNPRLPLLQHGAHLSSS